MKYICQMLKMDHVFGIADAVTVLNIMAAQ